ncbi:MAG: CYTH domain-containing protein [Burkholderiales bacterium]|jgi:adenylate cyclase|nr:CYTH domain-containing protein [Burkholderiales bacterium]
MGIEIERKFLVVGDAWRAQATRRQRMAQGYINDAAAVDVGTQRASVRVRIAGERAALNLKSRELGASRQEFEYAIPVADAEALLALCVGGTIDKTRHYVQHGAHLWEVDEFHGDNAGLVVAEIELNAVDETFERPPWLGAEVTELTRYYNLALAARPYAQWTNEEKNAC